MTFNHKRKLKKTKYVFLILIIIIFVIFSVIMTYIAFKAPRPECINPIYKNNKTYCSVDL